MPVKITTLQQVTQLLIGDVLLKCIPNIDQGNMSDEKDQKQTEIYEIRNINTGNQMMELVTPISYRILFPSPGDIGRLFIRSGHLITENVWWLQ